MKEQQIRRVSEFQNSGLNSGFGHKPKFFLMKVHTLKLKGEGAQQILWLYDIAAVN